jgi:hypothetical protein
MGWQRAKNAPIGGAVKGRICAVVRKTYREKPAMQRPWKRRFITSSVILGSTAQSTAALKMDELSPALRNCWLSPFQQQFGFE